MNANDLARKLGIGNGGSDSTDPKIRQYLNLKLAMLGCPTVASDEGGEFSEMVAALLLRHRETSRLLAGHLCPADQRIQKFLETYLKDTSIKVRVPGETFVLDRFGLARALSLPPDRDSFDSDIVQSYRIRQGVLHNPKSDRRTTQGVFHVAMGGLPIPDDKLAVPREVYGRLAQHAFRPPSSLMRLPYTSTRPKPAECFVSLLLRPVVCPEVPEWSVEKTTEIRFFAPGNLVGNLDFVESIFGNAGDPFLPENDAGLDTDHWTGHTGCVILAPHLIYLTKKELGLPPIAEATERQIRDGMCWERDDERYNGGEAFKVAARDASGVMVTLIADNYFGYCKKEVKTQISFSANLFGQCEEEHAGGVLVYPSYDLGEEFSGHRHVRRMDHTFKEMVEMFGDVMEVNPDGYAVDRQFPNIVYVPEDVHFDLHRQRISWPHPTGEKQMNLLADRTYVRPSGYRVQMEKPTGNRAWRLVGTVAEPTYCHKPCTVSGGGKSEISKPITDAIIHGPVFVADIQRDLDSVAELIAKDYSDRFRDANRNGTDTRTILSHERSLGSVIKLLTPAPREYSDEYNTWLESIPHHIKELVFVVKRFYQPEWGEAWRKHFSVDIINGTPGNELKTDNRKLVTNYLRVGFQDNDLWRTFGLRKDFHPAMKLPQEDDISVSVVAPVSELGELNPLYAHPAVKFIVNCEYRFFQRPDDAIHRGYDRQAEADLAQQGNFISNFEPLNLEQARELVKDSIGFNLFTPPMQRLIRDAAETDGCQYFVSSAHPRIVDGKPSKNPRYLQIRPDLLNRRAGYLAEMSTRLHRRIPPGKPVLTPVNAVVPGRRNNPPDREAGIRPLAVFNPIHYMELPELFMEFICSMTGKSPSTTGAGSEGALTKGPFNALSPIIDLNNALVSYLLTGYDGFVTAAGHLGPHARMAHDISLLIPEVWCRMMPAEREPKFLIQNQFLERCEDFDHDGRTILASRLGYRITRRFVRTFFGRVFNHPNAVFTDEMLRPELQDKAVFVDGMDNIVSTAKRVAAHYFNDGSVDEACPPLRALLHIMKDDAWEGKTLASPEVRAMFTREHLFSSRWYAARLEAKQAVDVRLWSRNVEYLEEFLKKSSHAEEAERLGITERLERGRSELKRVGGGDYLKSLKGTLGAHPIVQPTR